MSNLPAEQKHKFSVMITTKDYQQLIHNTLKDPKRATNFIANISAVVANNPALQDCEAATILSAGFLAESLNLSMSPQLGYCYLVPYETAVKDRDGKTVWLFDDRGNHLTDRNGKWLKQTVKKAQFQMGYRGYIQLAIRSGMYRKLSVLDIKEGELRHFDILNEDIEVDLIEDELQRENTPTAGYYAMFEYHSGFRKAIYWSKRKMMAHADKYSPAFSAAAYEKYMNGEIPENEMWRYSSFWYRNFDDMAKKTMLRQLISKWGIMSVEMEDVMAKDMSAIESDGSYSYIETDPDNRPLPQNEPKELNTGGAGELPFDESELPSAPMTEQPPETEELSLDDL